MKKLMFVSMVFSLTCGAFALTMVWPEQDAISWNDPSAIWKTTTGGSSAPPGVSDYAYILSTNEVTVDSAVEVKRLFIDRLASTMYPAVASTVTVVTGGTLVVNSICQPGHGIDGGTINIAGGTMIMSNSAGDRTGTYSLLMDDNFASILNITAGTLSIRNGSNFEFQANSQADVTVSGTGLIEFLNGSMLDMGLDALGVKISDGGLIKFAGRDASVEIQGLAEALQLTGLSPLATPLYTPDAYANGVGWYYDGNDTYAFTVIPEPATLFLLGLGSLALAKRRK